MTGLSGVVLAAEEFGPKPVSSMLSQTKDLKSPGGLRFEVDMPDQ